jgi:hypothetical protein
VSPRSSGSKSGAAISSESMIFVNTSIPYVSRRVCNEYGGLSPTLRAVKLFVNTVNRVEGHFSIGLLTTYSVDNFYCHAS